METYGIENGKVEVPRDYFLRMAKLDYEDYKKALAREFFQNSVDADSTSIHINFKDDRCIEVVDDGCGMDYDTIKNKLLVLGGSQKRSGNVGAFGKAKEVLYFSWERYEVRTRDLLVKGQGADYTIERVNSWHEGTTSTIWLWEDENIDSFRWAFQQVAEKFQVPCSIIINESAVNTSLKRGRYVRGLSWADLYVDDSKTNSWYLQVRINGQWMFSTWHGEDDLGELVLEVNRQSTDCLTSNRDALKSEYKGQFQELLKEILLDKQSALEATNPTIRTKYVGTGKVIIQLKKFAEEVKAQLSKLKPKKKLTKPEREEVMDILLDIIPAENMNPSRMDRIELEIDRPDFSFQDVQRLAFIGYEPDFVTVYETEDKSRVEKFMKTKKAKVYAKLWTEVLKQILLDIGWYGSFTAGFNFEPSKAAGFEKTKEGYFFYLNPDRVFHDAEFITGRYDSKKNKRFLLEDLMLKALHEITHINASYHNETFTTRVEWVRAQTWKSIDIYPRLIKEAFED